MGPEEVRIKQLLKDTISLLCKSSLQYESQLSIDGLLAISIDQAHNFCVHLSEKIEEENHTETVEGEEELEQEEEDQNGVDKGNSFTDGGTNKSRNKTHARRKNKHLGGPCSEDVSLSKNQSPSQSININETDSDSTSTSDVVNPHMKKIKLEQFDSDCSGDSSMINQELLPQHIKHEEQECNDRVPPLHDSNHEYTGDAGEETVDQMSEEQAYTAALRSMPDFTPGDPDDMHREHDHDEMDDVKAESPEWHPGDEIRSATFTRALMKASLRKVKKVAKPYMCDYPGCGCSYSFVQGLYQHQRIKHGRNSQARRPKSQQDIKPHGCQVPGCGARFYEKGSQLRHERTQHSSGPLVDEMYTNPRRRRLTRPDYESSNRLASNKAINFKLDIDGFASMRQMSDMTGQNEMDEAGESVNTQYD